MGIRERERDQEEEASDRRERAGNTLHVRDESEAREQLLERYARDGETISVDTSDDYEFAQKFQRQIKKNL